MHRDSMSRKVTSLASVRKLCGDRQMPQLPMSKPVLQGTAGEPLAPGQLAAALQGHDMFLYFGHGSGDQYLSTRYPLSAACSTLPLFVITPSSKACCKQTVNSGCSGHGLANMPDVIKRWGKMGREKKTSQM